MKLKHFFIAIVLILLVNMFPVNSVDYIYTNQDKTQFINKCQNAEFLSVPSYQQVIPTSLSCIVNRVHEQTYDVQIDGRQWGCCPLTLDQELECECSYDWMFAEGGEYIGSGSEHKVVRKAYVTLGLINGRKEESNNLCSDVYGEDYECYGALDNGPPEGSSEYCDCIDTYPTELIRIDDPNEFETIRQVCISKGNSFVSLGKVKEEDFTTQQYFDYFHYLSYFPNPWKQKNFYETSCCTGKRIDAYACVPPDRFREITYLYLYSTGTNPDNRGCSDLTTGKNYLACGGLVPFFPEEKRCKCVSSEETDGALESISYGNDQQAEKFRQDCKDDGCTIKENLQRDVWTDLLTDNKFIWHIDSDTGERYFTQNEKYGCCRKTKRIELTCECPDSVSFFRIDRGYEPDNQGCGPYDSALMCGSLNSAEGDPDYCQCVPNPDIPVDLDKDGIPDDFYGLVCSAGNNVECDDNCPEDKNPVQEDQDNDGIGDVCDASPYPMLDQLPGREECQNNDCFDDYYTGTYKPTFSGLGKPTCNSDYPGHCPMVVYNEDKGKAGDVRLLPGYVKLAFASYLSQNYPDPSSYMIDVAGKCIGNNWCYLDPISYSFQLWDSTKHGPFKVIDVTPKYGCFEEDGEGGWREIPESDWVEVCDGNDCQKKCPVDEIVVSYDCIEKDYPAIGGWVTSHIQCDTGENLVLPGECRVSIEEIPNPNPAKKVKVETFPDGDPIEADYLYNCKVDAGLISPPIIKKSYCPEVKREDVCKANEKTIKSCDKACKEYSEMLPDISSLIKAGQIDDDIQGKCEDTSSIHDLKRISNDFLFINQKNNANLYNPQNPNENPDYPRSINGRYWWSIKGLKDDKLNGDLYCDSRKSIFQRDSDCICSAPLKCLDLDKDGFGHKNSIIAMCTGKGKRELAQKNYDCLDYNDQQNNLLEYTDLPKDHIPTDLSLKSQYQNPFYRGTITTYMVNPMKRTLYKLRIPYSLFGLPINGHYSIPIETMVDVDIVYKERATHKIILDKGYNPKSSEVSALVHPVPEEKRESKMRNDLGKFDEQLEKSPGYGDSPKRFVYINHGEGIVKSHVLSQIKHRWKPNYIKSDFGLTMEDPIIYPTEYVYKDIIATPVDPCQDGLDNDCDGNIDCEDTDCFSSPCCEGKTRNLNGKIDVEYKLRYALLQGNDLSWLEHLVVWLARLLEETFPLLHDPNNPSQKLEQATIGSASIDTQFIGIDSEPNSKECDIPEVIKINAKTRLKVIESRFYIQLAYGDVINLNHIIRSGVINALKEIEIKNSWMIEGTITDLLLSNKEANEVTNMDEIFKPGWIDEEFIITIKMEDENQRPGFVIDVEDQIYSELEGQGRKLLKNSHKVINVLQAEIVNGKKVYKDKLVRIAMQDTAKGISRHIYKLERYMTSVDQWTDEKAKEKRLAEISSGNRPKKIWEFPLFIGLYYEKIPADEQTDTHKSGMRKMFYKAVSFEDAKDRMEFKHHWVTLEVTPHSRENSLEQLRLYDPSDCCVDCINGRCKKHIKTSGNTLYMLRDFYNFDMTGDAFDIETDVTDDIIISFQESYYNITNPSIFNTQELHNCSYDLIDQLELNVQSGETYNYGVLQLNIPDNSTVSRIFITHINITGCDYLQNKTIDSVKHIEDYVDRISDWLDGFWIGMIR